jgi:hypothetical protein
MTRDAKEPGEAGGGGDGPMFAVPTDENDRMAIAIVVKPDKDGLLRFTHKGETIVILVDYTSEPAVSPPLASAGNPPAPASLKPAQGTQPPQTGPKPRAKPDNPFDRPHPYLVAPEGDNLDVEATIKELLRRFAAQSEPDPDGLVLRVRKLDIHSYVELKNQIHETHPELPLGVDLSGFDKE